MKKIIITMLILSLFIASCSSNNSIIDNSEIENDSGNQSQENSVLSKEEAYKILESSLPDTSYKLYIRDDEAEEIKDGHTCYRFQVYSLGSEPIEIRTESGQNEPIFMQFTYAWAFVDKYTGELFKGDERLEHLIPWN